MNARQVFNGAYTVAGKAGHWYVLEGTPVIGSYMSLLSLALISVAPSNEFGAIFNNGFGNRGDAMVSIRERILRERKASV